MNSEWRAFRCINCDTLFQTWEDLQLHLGSTEHRKKHIDDLERAVEASRMRTAALEKSLAELRGREP